jgi:nitrate/TMAO reductase-like tetraheme cytochrome c subunit
VISQVDQIREQPPPLLLLLLMRFIGLNLFWSTSRMASSKTAFRPSCVRALHSMYLQSGQFS